MTLIENYEAESQADAEIQLNKLIDRLLETQTEFEKATGQRKSDAKGERWQALFALHLFLLKDETCAVLVPTDLRREYAEHFDRLFEKAE
jgi:hypothetical protein